MIEENLDNFKKNFFSSNDLVHLNNAGLSPSSIPAAKLVHQWMERFQNEGMHCNDDYKYAMEIARAQLAHMVGCESQSIAYFQSTAGAISQVAFGMKLNPGDEVLMWDQEYPSNLYPWREACKLSNANLKLVASDSDMSTPVDKLLAAVTKQTKVIAISWIQYQSGAITDLQALTKFAKSNGILTMVDVIQGLGIMPFDYKKLDIDFVCGGCHKWMASPIGVGFLVCQPEHYLKLRPITIGANTYGTCDDPTDLTCQPKLDAHRFEAGSRQVLQIIALGASADLLRTTGVEVIYQEASKIATKLSDGLRNLGYAINQPQNANAAFVNFSCNDQNTTLVQAESKLRTHKISYAVRGPGLRLTPNAFNSHSDVDRCLQALS